MSLFGIGASKSDTKTVSNAQSTDFSQSSSFGESNQSVFGADLFKLLYGDAAGAAGKVASNLPTFQGDARTLFSGGTDFLSGLMGGDAGSDYMTSRLSDGNDILQQQIEGLGSDLGKFFNEQLLPGITSEGVMSGNLGGGRQGVAQGAAAGEVARQFSQGVTALRSADQAQKDTVANNLTGARTAAAGVGLGALPSVLGLSQAGLTADMLPAQLLAAILGGPTTLTDSLQTSDSMSTGQSSAASKSKGGSSGFNFGFE